MENKPNQKTKFRTKNWVEEKDDAHGMYEKNNQKNLRLQCWSQVYVITVVHM